MVARINTSKSISKALNYNEQKVQQKQAEILHAQNFLKDADKLNFYDKLNHFKRMMQLNERTTTNTLHVSLNFDPSEKLPNDKLITIAQTYMERIGFNNQPYLIYRHYDAGHPHIHIVSTNIKRDGSRISMHNMGRNQSEKARKEIEIEFGLIKAESKKMQDALQIHPVNAQKAAYGKLATKQAISNVLGLVINQYKYCSLPELNAVLKLYNVVAERGEKGSKMYEGKGLSYRVLDEKGNKIGVPIKASAFYLKPTLPFLEKKFVANESLKQPHAKRLKASIDYTFQKLKEPSIQKLIEALEKEKISVVLRQNKEGIIYGITYVDHSSKCVFNGSELGKAYSAKMILEKCDKEEQKPFSTIYEMKRPKQAEAIADSAPSSLHQKAFDDKIIETLMAADPLNNYVPFQLKRTKKKRKKKRLSI